jgi:Zinc finger, C2H2 type
MFTTATTRKYDFTEANSDFSKPEDMRAPYASDRLMDVAADPIPTCVASDTRVMVIATKQGYQCESCNNPPYSTKANLKMHMKKHDTQTIDNAATEKNNANRRLKLQHMKTNDAVGYQKYLELERERRTDNLQHLKMNDAVGYQQHLGVERTRQQAVAKRATLKTTQLDTVKVIGKENTIVSSAEITEPMAEESVVEESMMEEPASTPTVTKPKRVRKHASRACTCRVPGACFGKKFKDTRYLMVHMKNKHRNSACVEDQCLTKCDAI